MTSSAKEPTTRGERTGSVTATATKLADRELKHRARSVTRPVPAPPPLVRALRWHIAAYGCAPDGRLFFVPAYGNKPVSKWSYANAWRQARLAALTPAQHRSPLGRTTCAMPLSRYG